MIFFCEECGGRVDVEEELPPGLNRVACPSCGFQNRVKVSSDSKPKKVQGRKEDTRLQVLIVDDSRVSRRVVRELLADAEDLTIVGEAENGVEALTKIETLSPDVVILDIIMPEMNGLTALKHIMIKFPRPVVMFSALTQDGRKETFDALNYGAVDFLQKPSMRNSDVEDTKKLMVEKIRKAADVKTENIHYLRTQPQTPQAVKTDLPATFVAIIGGAEGGYAALLKIIPNLEAGLPATAIVVIHDKEEHVRSFAAYLDEISRIPIRYAEDGALLSGSTCYLSSGENYVTLTKTDGRQVLHVAPSPFPGRRGAINMLMFSVVDVMKAKTLGILLSGAGDDGVEGAIEVERNGGLVLAQEPSTCLYKEMVQQFISQGKTRHLASDALMADAINNHIIETEEGEIQACLTT